MKRLLKIFVIVLFSISVFSINIYAEDKIYTEGTLKYIIESDDTITIIRHFGRETEIEIPTAIGFHYVTSIGPDCFDETVTYVKIPDTVTNIDKYAFKGDNTKYDYYDSYGNIVDKPSEETLPEMVISDDQKEQEQQQQQEQTQSDDVVEPKESVSYEEEGSEEVEIDISDVIEQEETNKDVDDSSKEETDNELIDDSIDTKDDTNIDTTDKDIQDDNIDKEYSVNPNSNYAFIAIGLVVIISIVYFVYRTIKKKK